MDIVVVDKVNYWELWRQRRRQSVWKMNKQSNKLELNIWSELIKSNCLFCVSVFRLISVAGRVRWQRNRILWNEWINECKTLFNRIRNLLRNPMRSLTRTHVAYTTVPTETVHTQTRSRPIEIHSVSLVKEEKELNSLDSFVHVLNDASASDATMAVCVCVRCFSSQVSVSIWFHVWEMWVWSVCVCVASCGKFHSESVDYCVRIHVIRSRWSRHSL